MTIQEILEAHRTLASSPADKVCACDWTWRPDAEYRAHLAEVLDKHMQERCYEAWNDGYIKSCADHFDGGRLHGANNINPYRKEPSDGC